MTTAGGADCSLQVRLLCRTQHYLLARSLSCGTLFRKPLDCSFSFGNGVSPFLCLLHLTVAGGFTSKGNPPLLLAKLDDLADQPLLANFYISLLQSLINIAFPGEQLR